MSMRSIKVKFISDLNLCIVLKTGFDFIRRLKSLNGGITSLGYLRNLHLINVLYLKYEF